MYSGTIRPSVPTLGNRTELRCGWRNPQIQSPCTCSIGSNTQADRFYFSQNTSSGTDFEGEFFQFGLTAWKAWNSYQMCCLSRFVRSEERRVGKELRCWE